ncbi:MAG: endonuclease/exonuclease/phosphatase family protein [Anaerolineae bacterium]|nr:endonuclease/exonuclease/phosphatase family protein [Anaerolineae bacterium]
MFRRVVSPEVKSSVKQGRLWVDFGASGIGAALLGVVIWQAWLPIEFPLLNLLGVFLPFLALPTVAMLLLSLGVKSRLGFFFGSSALLGLLVLCGHHVFLHQSPLVASEITPIVRATTFNLRYEYYEPADLSATILAQGADLVAVQEVAPSVMSDLAAMLKPQFPYVIPASSLSDLALFSRYPIIDSEWFHPAGDGRGALYAVIAVEGQFWHIFVVHPLPAGIAWLGNTLIPVGLYYGNLEAQMVDVLARAHGLEPVIVLGDFNMAEHSRAYRLISHQLTDSFHEAGQGWGFTFPQDVWIDGWQIPGPFVRLDYIFHSADLQASHAEVVCRGASDHCLVTADLALRP